MSLSRRAASRPAVEGRGREGNESRSAKPIDYRQPRRRVARVRVGGRPISARPRPISTFPRRCRQFAPVDESFDGRQLQSWRSSAAGAGIRECDCCDESSGAGRTCGRRENLHRLPSSRSRPLHSYPARTGSARGQSLRPDHSGLRSVPWSRLRTRGPSADQGAHHRLHEGFRYAHTDADEHLSDVPRRRSS